MPQKGAPVACIFYTATINELRVGPVPFLSLQAQRIWTSTIVYRRFEAAAPMQPNNNNTYRRNNAKLAIWALLICLSVTVLQSLSSEAS